jgi:hypothetical protein
MSTGLFFPLTDEEAAQVREAIRADGQLDTPEGRRSWLLARVRTPSKPNLTETVLEMSRTPQAKALGRIALGLLTRRTT